MRKRALTALLALAATWAFACQFVFTRFLAVPDDGRFDASLSAASRARRLPGADGPALLGDHAGHAGFRAARTFTAARARREGRARPYGAARLDRDASAADKMRVFAGHAGHDATRRDEPRLRDAADETAADPARLAGGAARLARTTAADSVPTRRDADSDSAAAVGMESAPVFDERALAASASSGGDDDPGDVVIPADTLRGSLADIARRAAEREENEPFETQAQLAARLKVEADGWFQLSGSYLDEIEKVSDKLASAGTESFEEARAKLGIGKDVFGDAIDVGEKEAAEEGDEGGGEANRRESNRRGEDASSDDADDDAEEDPDAAAAAADAADDARLEEAAREVAESERSAMARDEAGKVELRFAERLTRARSSRPFAAPLLVVVSAAAARAKHLTRVLLPALLDRADATGGDAAGRAPPPVRVLVYTSDASVCAAIRRAELLSSVAGCEVGARSAPDETKHSDENDRQRPSDARRFERDRRETADFAGALTHAATLAAGDGAAVLFLEDDVVPTVDWEAKLRRQAGPFVDAPSEEEEEEEEEALVVGGKGGKGGKGAGRTWTCDFDMFVAYRAGRDAQPAGHLGAFDGRTQAVLFCPGAAAGATAERVAARLGEGIEGIEEIVRDVARGRGGAPPRRVRFANPSLFQHGCEDEGERGEEGRHRSATFADPARACLGEEEGG